MASAFNFTNLKAAINASVEDNIKSLSIHIITGASDGSRVDTGRTVANWEANVDTISTAQRDPIASGGRKTTARRTSNKDISLRRAIRNINTFSFARQDQNIFIVNNIDYFARLYNNQDSTAITAIRNALARTGGV